MRGSVRVRCRPGRRGGFEPGKIDPLVCKVERREEARIGVRRVQSVGIVMLLLRLIVDVGFGLTRLSRCGPGSDVGIAQIKISRIVQ